MENDRRFRENSAYPTLRKEREGWGIRTLVVGGEKRQSFDGASPRLLRPTYPGANMGHPDRVGVIGIVDYQDTCSELA